MMKKIKKKKKIFITKMQKNQQMNGLKIWI